MSNTRRIPFVLDLDDPTDAAIWEVLEPLIKRRRASAWLRYSAAQTLGLAGVPVTLPRQMVPARLAAPEPEYRARRPALQSGPDLPEPEVEVTEADVEAAAANFLRTFG